VPKVESPLRVESTARSSAAARSGTATRGLGGAAFSVDLGGEAARAAAVDALAPSVGIDALLALQAVEDPVLAKKKAVRRGNALLDTLEAIKADLLFGNVSEGRLNQLMVLIGQARERKLDGLDAVLDDIELRARVELAKFGRYPAL
jgi:hypothetical protein